MRRAFPFALFLLTCISSVAAAQCLVCQQQGPDGPRLCGQSWTGVCTEPCCWLQEGDECTAPGYAYFCFSFRTSGHVQRATLFRELDRHFDYATVSLHRQAASRAAELHPFTKGPVVTRVFPSCECGASMLSRQSSAGS